MKLPIIRRTVAEPHQVFLPFTDVMDRFLKEGFAVQGWAGKTERIMRQWTPRVDISETDSVVKVKVDIPSVDPEKVQIELEGHTLTLSGKTENEKEESGEHWYRVERESGQFIRSLVLPKNVDLDRAKAVIKHGTVTIEIPKLLQQKEERAKSK